jgi:hypothetical protein
MINTTIDLYNKKLGYLGIDSEDVKAKISILKNEVSYWRQTILDDEAEISNTHCIVVLKNRESLLIQMNYNDFDKLMKTK